MAVDKRYLYKNVGTQEAPEASAMYAFFTLAECVSMDETGSQNIKQYVDKKITDLIGGATPETLDTLSEIATWIGEHKEVYEQLNTIVSGKADKNHRHDNASGTADGFMSKEHFTKLEGIEANANNYTHPENHPASMITQDATHQFVTTEEKKKFNDNTTYTNSTPIVSAHGGVTVGETFDKVPVQEMLDKILYPYVAPTLSTQAVPANGGTFEIGVGTNVTGVKATVGKKSRTIKKIEVFGTDSPTVALATLTEGVTNGGTFTLPLTKELKAAAQNGYRFTTKVTDADDKLVQATTGTFNLVYPFYYGAVAATASVDEAAVKALTKKVETKANKKWPFTANNQKMVFAYPASYGNLTKIFDANNFEVTDTFAKSTVAVTCADGQKINYNVYVNGASTVAGFNMDFRF